MDLSLFKAYDVHGTYPDQMDEELAYRIGRAFPRVLSQLEGAPVGELRVAVGRDIRLSPGHGRTVRCGDRRRGRRGARHRDGRHRHGLLDGRQPRGGRRPRLHGLLHPKAYTGAKLVQAFALS
jgi:hypothetical protein